MAPLELQFPRNREFAGGDLLAQSLKSLGVDVAFGIHGGHLDSFFMGCFDSGIRLVDTRHETVAVQAAEGYSKVKGTVGVAFVTANSGCVHTHLELPIKLPHLLICLLFFVASATAFRD